MADEITDLTDDDMRTEWPDSRSEMAEADDDGTDTGDGVDADDQSSDDDGTDESDADEPAL